MAILVPLRWLGIRKTADGPNGQPAWTGWDPFNHPATLAALDNPSLGPYHVALAHRCSTFGFDARAGVQPAILPRLPAHAIVGDGKTGEDMVGPRQPCRRHNHTNPLQNLNNVPSPRPIWSTDQHESFSRFDSVPGRFNGSARNTLRSRARGDHRPRRAPLFCGCQMRAR